MRSITFGAWLQQLRKKAGLTQVQLAERISCSVSALRKYETGERRAPEDQVERLIGALTLSAEEQDRLRKLARAPLTALPEASAEPRARRYPGALPNPATPFVGREALLATIRDRLRLPATRLLTLTGPPGIGKTRLAIAAGAAVQHLFADDVCFVPFAALGDPQLVIPTIARALGVGTNGAHDPLSVLVQALEDQQLLLILDNLEHLLDAVGHVAYLVERCPLIKVLATSRVRLNLRPERCVQVPPLELPPDTADWTTAAAAPAVQLFIDRAQAVVEAFSLTRENTAEVAAICRRLDGIPLAIELVAARSETDAPTELLQQLDRRLALLVDGPRDLAAHQRTLSSAIAWSYDRLGANEQRLFARLGVFTGGMTPAAIAAVVKPWYPATSGEEASLQSVPDSETDRLTTRLVEKSLLQVDLNSVGEPRYLMLETLRV